MFKRVLVTGGLGLIGSHLCERLAKKCKEIVILDDLSVGKSENLQLEKNSFRFVQGSILDSELVSSLMKDVEFCFHLAASLGVKKIIDSPIESLKTNLMGSENVFLAAAKNKVPIFIASTSEIYGKNPNQPLTEESERVIGSPLNIRWSYSEAKALDESMAQMYAYEYDLKFIIGRFFNTVGPRQTGEYGMVLPRFVKAAAKGEDIEVYGDGSQTRVFCHVRDAVSAIESLVSKDEAFGQVFNIGGRQEISIRELAELVVNVTNSTSRICFVPYDEAYGRGFEETFRRVPNTDKIKKLTHWEPSINLEDTIRDVYLYLK